MKETKEVFKIQESKKMKSNKGITLLTLIITVILLLIVSGVTLNIALGDNGLLKKSKEAVNKSRLARERRSHQNGFIVSIHRCRANRIRQAK